MVYLSAKENKFKRWNFGEMNSFMLAVFLWKKKKKKITFRFYTFKGCPEDGKIFYVSLLLPPALQNELHLFRLALPTCDNLIQRFLRQLKLQGPRFKVENYVLYP